MTFGLLIFVQLKRHKEITMDGTILGQGTFVASPIGASGLGAIRTYSNPYIAAVPSGVDWIRVLNYSAYGSNGVTTANFQGTGNASIGFEFYWQRGMPQGTALVQYKGAASAAVDADVLLTGGFTLYDPSGQTPGAIPLLSAPVATTATTNATQPVVSTGSTAGLTVGSVLRMSNTAQSDVNGIDMVVSAITVNTSFTLLFAGNALATAPGAIGGTGFYRIVNFDPIFYPRRRYITNITQAANGQVSTSVPHQYVAGQAVRFNIPNVSGMIQLNPTPGNNYLTATVVTVVDSYNFTININTSAFNAFTWPTIAQQPSSFPEVTPLGEDTASALLSTQPQTPIDIFGNQIFNTNTGILSDSTVNTAFLGMIFGSGGNGSALGTPILGPAGSGATSNAGVISSPDTLYWVAGKSTYGGL
jgi:hypothetical protein